MAIIKECENINIRVNWTYNISINLIRIILRKAHGDLDVWFLLTSKMATRSCIG